MADQFNSIISLGILIMCSSEMEATLQMDEKKIMLISYASIYKQIFIS